MSDDEALVARKRNLKSSTSQSNGMMATEGAGDSVITEDTEDSGLAAGLENAPLQKKLSPAPATPSPTKLVIWSAPLTVLKYSLLESLILIGDGLRVVSGYRKSLVALLVPCVLLGLLHLIPGTHQQDLLQTEKYLLWCGWWVWLGILSSVGLGTGLHTFLLFLGPHIASVTMAAYECSSTDFPEPPYPATILCPEHQEGEGKVAMTIWAILSKVRVEAFCWGAGTAIGELPPYFMARAARLSGSEPGEDTEEFLELQEKLKNPEKMTRFERAKYAMQQLVERVGFFGILAAASIPNPLFDLAGITCGHFLVPFGTFFGATLIGKAIIKMHIQKVFVILAFNQQLFDTAISFLVKIPVIGSRLEEPVRNILVKQKEKLHGGSGEDSGGSFVGFIFEKFVLVMVAYFVVSILNSLAQNYEKRLTKAEHKD